MKTTFLLISFLVSVTFSENLALGLTSTNRKYFEDQLTIPDSSYKFSEWGKPCKGMSCRIGCYSKNIHDIFIEVQVKNDSTTKHRCTSFKLDITPYHQFVLLNPWDLFWYFDSSRYKDEFNDPDIIQISGPDTLKMFTKLDYQLFDKDTAYSLRISVESHTRNPEKEMTDEQKNRLIAEYLAEDKAKDKAEDKKETVFNNPEIGYLNNPTPIYARITPDCEMLSESVICKIKGKPANSYSTKDLIYLLNGSGYQQSYASKELSKRGDVIIKDLLNSVSSDENLNRNIFSLLERIDGKASASAILENFPKSSEQAQISACKLLIKYNDALHPDIYKKILFCNDPELVVDIIHQFEKHDYITIIPQLKKLIENSEYWDVYCAGSQAILKLTNKFPDSLIIHGTDTYIEKCCYDSANIEHKDPLKGIKFGNIWPYLFRKYLQYESPSKASLEQCNVISLFKTLDLMGKYKENIDPFILKFSKSKKRNNLTYAYDAAFLIVALNKEGNFSNLNLGDKVETERRNYETDKSRLVKINDCNK